VANVQCAADGLLSALDSQTRTFRRSVRVR
jgi:hypothetical protein